MAEVVVIQPRLPIEILPREAHVQRDRLDRDLCLAVGQIIGRPRNPLSRVRRGLGRAQVVRVHESSDCNTILCFSDFSAIALTAMTFVPIPVFGYTCRCANPSVMAVMLSSRS